MSLESRSLSEQGVVGQEKPRLREPFISVVTVSLNAAGFIGHNLQSVAAQTYPHREHIVIDGGSTDGTVDIIRRYSPHLSYWHSRKDRGISHALNLGLAQARGGWVLFLNSDDFLLDSSVLEIMAGHLQNRSDADVVYGRRSIMTRETEPRLLREGRGRPWKWKEFRWRQTIPHPAAFINRSFFNRVGGFDEVFRIAMDYDFFLRDRQNLKARYVPLPITGMRDGGCCRQNIIRTLLEAGRAQRKNQTSHIPLVWLNSFYQIGRYYLASLYFKIVKPKP
jgi:glycosyltransferase involved in cell wall biosynthesis